MPEVTTTTGHYHPGSIQIAEFRIWEIQALGQELEIYKYIVKLRRGSGKDWQGMAPEAKGLKA